MRTDAPRLKADFTLSGPKSAFPISDFGHRTSGFQLQTSPFILQPKTYLCDKLFQKMNKTLLTLSKLGAGLVFAAVVVSCNKEQPKTSAPATSAAASDKKSEEVVYVNSDSLVANAEFYKDIRAKLEAKSKKAQTDLTAKGNAFQREVAEYRQSAQTLSADQRAVTEQRLARKQQELEAFNQNASSALANESAAENAKLYDKVAEYLKGYAKEKGYKLVLTYSKTNPTVLFADESLDVTKEVVNGLNESYKKEKK